MIPVTLNRENWKDIQDGVFNPLAKSKGLLEENADHEHQINNALAFLQSAAIKLADIHQKNTQELLSLNLSTTPISEFKCDFIPRAIEVDSYSELHKMVVMLHNQTVKEAKKIIKSHLVINFFKGQPIPTPDPLADPGPSRMFDETYLSETMQENFLRESAMFGVVPHES